MKRKTMQTEEQSGAGLLARLDREPDRAMEALVEQYTALVCHVASKYLTDPEDVKECVNDVFTEVYLHRAEYDPEKGGLAAWIGTIARNRAISLYRKQRKDQPLPEDGAEPEADGPDGTAELEQAMDVEQAISQLSETDQQIIRMKYYGGMSIAEIAETLHIPYETVKKRHTRSIKQMRKLLLTILIIAALLILAACGVIQLLRHLGVLPGYGVTADPTGACYVLEEPVTYQEGLFTVEIIRASMFDGRLAVHYRLDMDKTAYELPERDENGEATWRRLTFANDLRDGVGAVLDCSSSSGYGSAPWDSSEFSVEGDRVCWLTGKSLSAFRSGQRQELTLACMYLDWDLRTEIIKFNKSQDQVRIVVKDYSQYATEEDYNAGLQKLNTEILSGVVPDLFAVDSNLPLASYGSKGILTDLWTLIDADPELSRDDLMAHLFDVMSLDGKLYQIVDTFSINTVAGRTDRIGTADSWTVAELMDVRDSLPEGATVCGGMDTKNDMMNTCVYRNIDSFVDWANLQCRFDSQEFIDLLTFVNSFPQEFDYENFDWDAYGSDYDRLASGKQMLLYAYLSSFNDVQRMDAITDGKPNYIGYPTTEGSGSSFQVYGGLAISASCKNMDAAWSFVRRFLTEDYQTKEYMWEFPTNRHAFENYAKQRMTPQYTEDPETGEQVKQPQDWYWVNDDLTIEIYEMTQEEYDRFLAVYEKTDRMNSYNQAISDIIGQECEAFFAGQKTAEETAKLIFILGDRPIRYLTAGEIAELRS